MKKLLHGLALVCISILFMTGTSYSANEQFRSIASGNWNSTSTWEMSINGGTTWIPATLTPTDVSGAITIRTPNTVTVTVNVNADQLTVETGGTLFINSGIILTIFDASGTDLTINTSGNVSGPGTVKVQGGSPVINIRAGSNFSASLNINTADATIYDLSSPNIGKLYGPVTVDAGATISMGTGLAAVFLEFYGNLTNNGTLTSSGTNSKKMRFKGPALVNNGTISTANFDLDSISTISGAGAFASPVSMGIGANGNITLLSDVTISTGSAFNVSSGATLNPNGFTFNYTSGTFTLNSGSTVVNSGLFRTKNIVFLNLRGGSNFNAPLNVNTGTTNAYDQSPPYVGALFGPVTVDAIATLAMGTGNTVVFLELYRNLTNNGTLTSASASGKKMRFKGPALVNNGTISTANFDLDSISTVSGAGAFASSVSMGIGANGNITLLTDVTISAGSAFNVSSGATLNPNGFTFNYTSGTFTLNSGSTIVNSGLFRTKNTVFLNLRGGSFFNIPLNVSTGTTNAYDQSAPNIGKLYGPVTVDAGNTLGLGTGLGGVYLEFYGNVTNNGTLAGVGASSKKMTFKGSALVNNGIITTPIFTMDTTSTIYGTGTFTSNLFFINSAAVTLTSNHNFANVNISPGTSFDISNNIVKFTASNPILQNGTFTTTGSDIEYNGTALQSVSATNINYVGLRINNPAGATLLGNINIPDTLSVISGDLNLNAKIITLTPTAFLNETSGNLVFGTSGFITTTRNLGAPNGLNVAGMGAVLTTSTNLGSTEIRRGHTVQSGLNGGTSIKRYYDITPTTNTGLNATLVFKYDDSELNGKPEPSLKLFKSTNSGSTWLYQIGSVNIITNEITLSGISSFSRWSSDSSAVSASVKMVIQGFYNPASNRMDISDTVRAFLRNPTIPFEVVDSAIALVNSITLKAGFQFNNATSGSYYLQLKHRNALETWSSNALVYNTGMTLNYDFAFAANMAFGSNQTQVDAAPLTFAFWSGDVNQDGIIDAGDISGVENDALNATSGYVPTDVTGDDFVDGSDVSLVENNAAVSVSVITP